MTPVEWFWLGASAALLIIGFVFAHAILDEDDDEDCPSRYVDPGIPRGEDHASATSVYRASSRTERR